MESLDLLRSDDTHDVVLAHHQVLGAFDLHLIGLLSGGVGDNDSTGGLVFRVQTLDHDAIVQGTYLVHHEISSFKKLAATNQPCGHDKQGNSRLALLSSEC